MKNKLFISVFMFVSLVFMESSFAMSALEDIKEKPGSSGASIDDLDYPFRDSGGESNFMVKFE